MCNKGHEWSDEFKKKVSTGVRRAYEEGRLKPYAHWTGKKMSIETKQKMSESAKNSQNSGRFQKGSKVNLGRVREDMRGSNHWNWKGGITKEATKRVNDPIWRALIKIIYERDNWTCQVCGKHCRQDIQCHHIIPVNEDGTDDPSNLITLCRAHHLKIERSEHQKFWRCWLLSHISISLN